MEGGLTPPPPPHAVQTPMKGLRSTPLLYNLPRPSTRGVDVNPWLAKMNLNSQSVKCNIQFKYGWDCIYYMHCRQINRVHKMYIKRYMYIGVILSFKMIWKLAKYLMSFYESRNWIVRTHCTLKMLWSTA